MKLRQICLTLAALLCGGQLLNADILILKNGEKKEGNIVQENPDSVRMKYKITPKIWDEKDFPRADIQQIIKQKPEEIEIVELRKLVPTPDLLTADGYEQLIQDKLRPFVNKYPGTPQTKEVEALIAELQKEKEKVVAGQGKLEGQWLTAEMMKRDDYNIQAYKIRRSMLEKAAAQDYVGALREYDRLEDATAGYPGSLQYVKAIPEAIDIMTKYEAVISRMISEQPIFQKQRDESLKKLVEPDLGRTKAAIDREVNGWKAVYDSEKKSKVRWQTQYKYDIKALQEALKLIISERGKLQLLDLSKLQSQNEALTKAMRYLADENVAEADAALKTAQTISTRDASRLIATLRARVTTMKADQAKNKNLNRSMGAGSSAVSGSSAAIQDDRVAQAMAAADQSKKPAADDKAEAPGEKPVEDKNAKSKTKASKAKAAASEAKASAPAAEESGMQKYLMIGAGVLIIVLLIAVVAQKKKN